MKGRPTLLTEELQAKICELVEAGDRPEVAAGVNGVKRSTYYEWSQRGANGEEPYATFRTEVARALDVFESESRRVILSGDGREWSCGPSKQRLEVLARRMPKHWAERVKHHVERVEDEFLDTLEEVCSDPAVHARVCEAEDCSFLFAAFCEALARRESESEAEAAPGGIPATTH